MSRSQFDMKKSKEDISKTRMKSTKRIDEIVEKEEFYRGGEEEIRSVLKEAKRIKVETGKRIVEGLWKEQGEKCIGLLTDVDIDYGLNSLNKNEKNDKNEERRIIIENMKSIFAPMIETKVLGIPIFKIVVEFFENGGEFVFKEEEDDDDEIEDEKEEEEEIEEAEEGGIEVDWEYEYEEAKKTRNMNRIRKISKEELMKILRKKKEEVKKMKEATAEEAVNKYCEDEGDREKCLKILEDIREGRMKIKKRELYCSGKARYRGKSNDPLLITIKKAIEANDCPCVMALSRGCYLPYWQSINNDGIVYSLFGYSCEVYSDECALFLLEAGGGIEQKFSLETTPLMEALRSNNEVIGLYLIEEGANIKAKSKSGDYTLHYAAIGICFEGAKLLMERGLDIEMKNDNGETPLHCAAQTNRVEVAKLLIERGADIEAKDKEGKTPLHEAASWDCIENAKLLIERGADIEVKDEYGETPLHMATLNNKSSEVANLLIERGADIEVRDKDGETPLHRAAFFNNAEVAQLLIARGADIEAKDKDGRTPLQRAFRKKVKVILEEASNRPKK